MECQRVLSLAQAELPGDGEARSLHLLQQSGTRRRTVVLAGKPCPVSSEAVRSRRTHQPGPQTAAKSSGRRGWWRLVAALFGLLTRIGLRRSDTRAPVKPYCAQGSSLRDVVEIIGILDRIRQFLVHRSQLLHAALRLMGSRIHNSGKRWRCPARAAD